MHGSGGRIINAAETIGQRIGFGVDDIKIGEPVGLFVIDNSCDPEGAKRGIYRRGLIIVYGTAFPDKEQLIVTVNDVDVADKIVAIQQSLYPLVVKCQSVAGDHFIYGVAFIFDLVSFGVIDIVSETEGFIIRVHHGSDQKTILGELTDDRRHLGCVLLGVGLVDVYRLTVNSGGGDLFILVDAVVVDVRRLGKGQVGELGIRQQISALTVEDIRADRGEIGIGIQQHLFLDLPCLVDLEEEKLGVYAACYGAGHLSVIGAAYP